MSLDAMLALIAATAVLVAMPRPNLALFIANTLSHGLRAGAVTMLGTATGIAVQLVLVLLGLAALLALAASALVWLKWAGVAYLVYLGVTSWRRGARVDDDAFVTRGTATASAVRPYSQGLMLSIINPKTLLFNAAFIPQFVHAELGASGLLLPAVIYLGVILIGDLIWVALAGSARPFILKFGRLRHRLTGALFMASGLGLALARLERS